MSTLSNRQITVSFTGDVTFPLLANAAPNATSPGETQLISLALGANTIAVPPGSTGLTITKPASNATALTLKGVSGDTGIPLHLTDPDSISLNPGQSSIVLTAAAAVSGIRLTWT